MKVIGLMLEGLCFLIALACASVVLGAALAKLIALGFGPMVLWTLSVVLILGLSYLIGVLFDGPRY